MKGKLFRTSLFGLKKDDVYTYLEKLNSKLVQEMEEKNAIIADLRAQLKKRRITIETQTSDELMENARQQAELILQRGQSTLLESKEKLKKEIKEEKMKLRLLQAEVAGLKKNAVEAAAKFTSQLEPLLVENS